VYIESPVESRYGYAGGWGYETHDIDSNGAGNGTPDNTLNAPPAVGFPFMHVGARYYDPATGRFLQRDPIGIRGGLNVYAYVRSNPMSHVDPSGLLWGDTIEGWVAENIWMSIHDTDTLAEMSDGRAAVEAVGLAVGFAAAGTAGYVAGTAASAAASGPALLGAASVETVSLSIGLGGAGITRLHLAVGSSTAGWWHWAGPIMGARYFGTNPYGWTFFTFPARYPDAVKNISDMSFSCATAAFRAFAGAL
jgi:hypothetical protein